MPTAPSPSPTQGRLLWGAILCLCLLQALWRQHALLPDKPVTLTDFPAVIDAVHHRPGGGWLRLDLGDRGHLHLSQYAAGSTPWQEGDRLTVSGQLVVDPKSDRLRLNDATLTFLEHETSWRLKFREHYRRLAHLHLDEEAARLTPALLLGDRESFHGAGLARFRLTGTFHYLALSGLHLGLLAWPWILLGRLFNLSPARQLAAALPAIVFFLYLAGPLPSLMRAAISFGLLLLAHVLRRGLDVPAALCAVASLCLILQPGQVQSAGFALTFAALIGLTLIGPRLSALGGSQPPWLWPFIAYNTGAWLALMPVLWWHFGEVHPVALLLNLVLTPIIALMLTLAQLFPLWPETLGPVLNLIWDGMFTGLDLALEHGRSPWSPTSTPLAALVTCGVILHILWRPLTRWRTLGLFGLVIFSASLPVASTPTTTPTAIQFDVGQGSSALVTTRPGSGLLIDCGGSRHEVGSRHIVPGLRRHGIQQLDLILLTHLDFDHRGGLEDILARFPVGQLAWNPQGAEPAAVKEVRRLAARHHVPLRTLSRGERLQFDRVSLTVWHPTPTSPGPENERSVVVSLKGPRHQALFLGDLDERGTRDLLLREDLQPVEMITAPHHGSRNRHVPALLRRLQPREIWLSARPNFPREPAILKAPQLRASWTGEHLFGL